MNIIAITITSFFILATFAVIVFAVAKAVKNKGKNIDERHFLIRQPLFIFLIGVIGSLFFCAFLLLMTLFPNDTATWYIHLGFSLFVVLCLSMMLWGTRWELHVNGSQIEYTPFLGKKRVISIDQITKIWQDIASPWGPKIRPTEIKAYSGEKRLFTVLYSARRFNKLISYLENEKIPFEDNI